MSTTSWEWGKDWAGMFQNRAAQTRPGNTNAAGPTARATASTEEDEPEPLLARPVRRHEVLCFLNELSIMVNTGISLASALNTIASQTQNPTLAQVIRELRRAVEAGQDFSAALAKYPKYFDKTCVQLVIAGEASGALGEMLARVVDQGRRDAESRGKVRAALTYPAIMLVASIAASIFLLVYVFPKFTPLFQSRGIALPLPTRIMIAVSDFFVYRWYIALAIAVALVGAFFWFAKTRAGRRILDRVKLDMPVLGPMFRRASLSRSLRTLANMLAAGVPLIQALQLTGQVAGNVCFEDEWNRVAEGVLEGKQIHQVMEGSEMFPHSLVQMIAAAEQSGTLDQVLARVAEYYERELDLAIKAATSVIEPVMVCVMGGVIGTIAMGLLLPIFTLSRHVG